MKLLLVVDNLLDVNSMERILDGLLLNYNRNLWTGEISGEFNFPFKVCEKSRNWNVGYKNRKRTKISVAGEKLWIRGETSQCEYLNCKSRTVYTDRVPCSKFFQFSNC